MKPAALLAWMPLAVAVAVAGPAAAGPLRDPFQRPRAPDAAAAAIHASTGANTGANRGANAGATPAANPAATATDDTAAAHPGPPPRLHAVLLAGSRSLADIDGQVLGEGERFGDWRVDRIGERQVRLRRDRDELVLPLDREQAR